MKKSIGYDIKNSPKQVSENDSKCPYSGDVPIRGKIFEGVVVSDSMDRTVKVEWENLNKDPKYSRYFKKKSSVLAHNPDCINAKKGDKVLIGECRPLSKRKHFAVIKVIAEVAE